MIAELRALEDPQILRVDERHGDDHAVNLSKLRAVAKRLGPQPELARQLWDTDDSAARLLSILIWRPQTLDSDELSASIRQARSPKVLD